MPSKRVGESLEEYRERNKQYCKEYKESRDYNYKYKNSSPEIKAKERESCRIREIQNYHERKKFNPIFIFCQKIRRITYKLFPHHKIGICPDCLIKKDIQVHHFVYTFPVLQEHLGYKCNRCHGKWHKNNTPKILVVNIPIENGNCIICGNVFEKDPPNKITCSKECAKINNQNHDKEKSLRFNNAGI